MKLDVGKIDCLRLFFACSFVCVCLFFRLDLACALLYTVCFHRISPVVWFDSGSFCSLFFGLPFVGLVPIVFQVLSLSSRSSLFAVCSHYLRFCWAIFFFALIRVVYRAHKSFARYYSLQFCCFFRSFAPSVYLSVSLPTFASLLNSHSAQVFSQWDYFIYSIFQYL